MVRIANESRAFKSCEIPTFFEGEECMMGNIVRERSVNELQECDYLEISLFFKGSILLENIERRLLEGKFIILLKSLYSSVHKHVHQKYFEHIEFEVVRIDSRYFLESLDWTAPCFDFPKTLSLDNETSHAN